jgi:protein-disulfide isomerase
MNKANFIDLIKKYSHWLIIFAVVAGLVLFAVLYPRPQYPEVSADRLANDPTLGPADAKVTIIEYADYACPGCKSWYNAGVLQDILKKYPDSVRFIYRDNARISPASVSAANAAQCAYDQGKFWEYHDLLFENPVSFSPEGLKTYADMLGLDRAQFDTCLESGAYVNKVRHSMKLAGEHGFSFTPAFLVNDEVIVGPPSETYLSGLIESMLNGS